MASRAAKLQEFKVAGQKKDLCSAYLDGVCRFLLLSKVAFVSFVYLSYKIRSVNYIFCKQLMELYCRHPFNEIFLNHLMMIFFKATFLMKSADIFL